MLKVAEKLLLFLLLLTFPSQLAYHFWPQFSLINEFRVDYLSPTVYFTDLLIISLLLTGWINRRTFLIKNFKLSGNIVLIFLLVITNILFSISPLFSLYKYFRLSEYLYLYLYLAGNMKMFVPGFSRILPLTISWVSLLVFWQSYLQHSVGGLWFWLGERNLTPAMLNVAKTTVLGSAVYFRPYATFSHPNALAGFLCVGLLILIYLLHKSRTNKKLILLSFTLGTCALTLTFSRSVMAVFAVSILLLFIKNKLKSVIISLIALTIFLTSGIFNTVSFSERLLLFAKAIQLVIKNPFFGIGLGNFPLVQNSDVFSNFFLNFQPVHNVYLLLTTELGILLIGFTIYFLIKYFCRIWLKIEPSLKYSAMAILVLGMVDHYWITSHQNILLIVFLSVIISVKSGSDKHAE